MSVPVLSKVIDRYRDKNFKQDIFKEFLRLWINIGFLDVELSLGVGLFLLPKSTIKNKARDQSKTKG